MLFFGFLKYLLFLFKKDYESFEHIEGWVEDVRQERGDDVVIMIVGNKADEIARRFILSLFLIM